MYNASNKSLNAQININTKVDSKRKAKFNFVTSCLTFKSFIPIHPNPKVCLSINTLETFMVICFHCAEDFKCMRPFVILGLSQHFKLIFKALRLYL